MGDFDRLFFSFWLIPIINPLSSTFPHLEYSTGASFAEKPDGSTQERTFRSPVSTHSTGQETPEPGSTEDEEQDRWDGWLTFFSGRPCVKRLITTLLARVTESWTGTRFRFKDKEKVKRTPVSATYTDNTRLGTSELGCAEQRNQDVFKRASDLFWTEHSSGANIKVIFLTLLIFCFMTLSSATNDGTYCAVQLAGNLNQWRLICHFQENVQKSSQDFQVYHIKPEGRPVLVVDGKWIEGEPKVFTAPGYDTYGGINDTAIIMIQSRVAHHGAMFSCLLPPGLLEDAWTCHVPKLRELDSAALVSAQPSVPVPNEGWRIAPYRKMLLLTAAIMVYQRFKAFF